MSYQLPDFSKILQPSPSKWTPAQSAWRGVEKAQSGSLTTSAKAPLFRGANLEIQSHRGNEWVLSGPAETGKTWATVWLLDELLRTTPRANAVIARKQQVSLWSSVLVTYKRIQELRESMGEKPSRAYGGEKPEWFNYDNGSRLWVAGIDNPGKALSSERDWIYINQTEELLENDWETLLTRATGRGAVTKTPMLFGDCNPGAENHWIMKRPTLKVYHSKHIDNPSLFDESGNVTEQGERSIRILRSLTGVRKKRLFEGLWVGVDGLYFENWDEELHACAPFDIPADWPVWAALDYGFAHPTAFGLFTANEGTIYMIGEHVQHKWLVPQQCIAINRLIQRLKIPKLKRIVAGHDVFQMRGDKDGLTIADQYATAKHPETGEKIGLKFERATIERVTGWQEIVQRLGNLETGIAPTLKIFKTCTRTIAGITRLVNDPHDPEDVKKTDADLNGEGGDDEGDMLRYGVMEYSKIVTQRFRTSTIYGDLR